MPNTAPITSPSNPSRQIDPATVRVGDRVLVTDRFGGPMGLVVGQTYTVADTTSRISDDTVLLRFDEAREYGAYVDYGWEFFDVADDPAPTTSGPRMFEVGDRVRVKDSTLTAGVLSLDTVYTIAAVSRVLEDSHLHTVRLEDGPSGQWGYERFVLVKDEVATEPTGVAEFKVGDRVEIVDYSDDQWGGPATVTNLNLDGSIIVVRSDNPERSGEGGFDVQFVRHLTESTPDDAPRPLEVGDRVRITSGAREFTGKIGTIASIDGGSGTLTLDDPPSERRCTDPNGGAWLLSSLERLSESAPVRPTIDFSGSSRATARQYAEDLDSRILTDESRAALKAVAAGEQVDAYRLNAALLDAMRSCTTRDGQSTARRARATRAAYLGHITQAVLENHADDLPAYVDGERSRKVETLEGEVVALKAAANSRLEEFNHEVSDLKLALERETNRATNLADERTTLTQAASDERRRLCEEIDSHTALIRDLKVKLANADKALDYAKQGLTDVARAQIDGFVDGLDA